MSRKAATVNYLRDLVNQYDAISAERETLLNPQARLAEIAAARQELIADAREALDKLNAMDGTSYTLADLRRRFNPPDPKP